MINLPNLLTSIRILLIPVFIFFFWEATPKTSVIAAIVFLLASLTDLLDGYLARRWKQITNLGKVMDPIADKLLILSALILLVEFHRIPAWIAIVLIGRDIAVTGLRAMASSEGIIIPADRAGKYKLAIQVTAIILLILGYEIYSIKFMVLGNILLDISVLFAVFSAIQYIIKYGRDLQVRGRSPS